MCIRDRNDAARLFYAVSLIYSGHADEATAIVGGSNVESDATLVQAYLDMGRFDIIENLAKKKISANPNDVQLHVSLAALYLKAKRNNDAIAELKIASNIEPRFKPQADEYIKMIQSGKDPSQQ